jgi:hypothetical protein
VLFVIDRLALRSASGILALPSAFNLIGPTQSVRARFRRRQPTKMMEGSKKNLRLIDVANHPKCL